MDLSWPMCEEVWDCLPWPRGFQSQEEDVFWKDWAWQHNRKEENREFQSQQQREAWSGQGLGEQSQQQLGSSSRFVLQLTCVQAWTYCLYSFVKYLSEPQGSSDCSVVQQRPQFRCGLSKLVEAMKKKLKGIKNLVRQREAGQNWLESGKYFP